MWISMWTNVLNVEKCVLVATIRPPAYNAFDRMAVRFLQRSQERDEGTRKGPPNSTTLPLPLHAPTSFAVGTGAEERLRSGPLRVSFVPLKTYMTLPIILSYIQVAPLLEARRKGLTTVEISPDLGLTTVHVSITADGVLFPNDEYLNWQDLEKIGKSEVNCFVVEHNSIKSIQVFSEYTNRVCSLLPTKGAPSMLIAGFVMHRIKDIDPLQDTRRKIAAIAPVIGRVLDTATGLGYTAIEAAKTAEEVVTIELDPGAQEIARLNPWSQELFRSPEIRQIMGDASELVYSFEDESFSRIIHDPPTFSLAGDLYSGAFYRELHRILKRGGRLFHYIGDPDSKASGGVTKGVLRRLQDAGFARVVRRPEAYGVVAYK